VPNILELLNYKNAHFKNIPKVFMTDKEHFV